MTAMDSARFHELVDAGAQRKLTDEELAKLDALTKALEREEEYAEELRRRTMRAMMPFNVGAEERWN